MKKILSFLFICLLSFSSIFLMGCDLNTLLGEESNESYEDILLPTEKKVELIEDGYTVNLIVNFDELKAIRLTLCDNGEYVENDEITAVLTAVKGEGNTKETIQIFYCKDTKSAENVEDAIKSVFSNGTTVVYGYTVTLTYSGNPSQSGNNGGENGGNNSGENGRDYSAAVDTVFNDLESNGWECEVIDEKEQIMNIVNELGLDSFDIQVVLIANKFYGASNTATLVIFAEDANEANEMAGAINKAGFENDNLTVKNADIYVTVSQKLDADYFGYILSQDGYENIGKLEDEELAEFADVYLLNEGDVLGFVSGEKESTNNPDNIETVTYIILKDSSVASTLMSKLKQDNNLDVTGEGDLLIVVTQTEKTLLELLCEDLEEEGYEIYTILDDSNDNGVLYTDSIIYGFDDNVFAFKVCADKNITIDNLNTYSESVQYWCCINEEVASQFYSVAQETFTEGHVSKIENMVCLATTQYSTSSYLPEDMAADKLALQEAGWLCTDEIYGESECNSMCSVIIRDGGPDLIGKIYGYMCFKNSETNETVTVRYVKDYNTKLALHGHLINHPTYIPSDTQKYNGNFGDNNELWYASTEVHSIVGNN